MPVKLPDLVNLAAKLFGTLLLVAGFIFLVSRSPFMDQSLQQAQRDAGSADGRSLLAFPNRSGALVVPESVAPLTATSEGALPGSLGLLKAEFGDGMSPGFMTSEHTVPGQCAEAGRRFALTQCPDCDISTTPDFVGDQQMLIWSPHPGKQTVHSVSLDCTGYDRDGSPLVTLIAFGDQPVNLAGSPGSIARGRVPLVPGAKRLAAFELGGWLAVLDEVSAPQQAMGEMQRSLTVQGWRAAKGADLPDLPGAEDQLVFTNAANELCVVTLSMEDGANQLLTIISSKT